MTNFALVLFETGDNGAKPAGRQVGNISGRIKGMVFSLLFKAGFYKSSFCTRLFLFANRHSIRMNISKVELLDDVEAWIIRLPVKAGSLSGFNRKAVGDYVYKLCEERNIRKCFMPPCAAAHPELAGFMAGHEFREQIFKAHLEYILDDIYKSSAVRPGMPDTVIVAGMDGMEVCSFVRRLEPRLKYLTVAAQNSVVFEEELAGISADTGLMINTTVTWKTALKNAGLIVNLAGAAALSGYRIQQTTLVINFNNGADTRMPGEYAAIGGIEYLLPEEAFLRLGTEVLHNYSKKEISEAVMDLVLECHSANSPDDAGSGYITRLFAKYGCKITGYTGRRGIIKTESIIRLVRNR